jgi:hypothetical protein
LLRDDDILWKALLVAPAEGKEASKKKKGQKSKPMGSAERFKLENLERMKEVHSPSENLSLRYSYERSQVEFKSDETKLKNIEKREGL